MRHNNKINHLGRTHAHRESLFSNMAVSLIMHKRIFVTLAKAKELRCYIEPIITKSKTDTTHSRRIVFSKLRDKYAVTELFQNVSQKIGDRPGGYTRIIKTGNRKGDNASMCFIELVDYNELMLKDVKKATTRTRRSRGGRQKTIEAIETKKVSNAAIPQVAYESAKIVQLVGFREIYREQEIPTIESLLVNIPREKIIDVAKCLINLYKNADINGMQKFFSSQNKTLKDDFNNRFSKLQISKPNVSFNFCAIQTATELLKQSFAIPYKQQEAIEAGFEENILKAILVINDRIMDFKPKIPVSDPQEQLAELMVVNSFSQKDINNFDYNEVFREAFTKSLDLFEYISTDTYFTPIYQRFLGKLQINDYKEYITTILGLFGIIRQNVQQNKQNNEPEQWAGTFQYDPANDTDKLIHTSVLDYISIPVNKDVALSENEDYKVFRDKPLIKIPDSSYEIVNVGFLLERLFSSLYFDFKTIAKELDLSDFEGKYKENFMEKTLLCKYLEMINQSKRYMAMSSEDSLKISTSRGEPDYYLKSKDDNVILFENKDILINGAVKESRDLDKIIAEYKNKLLLKTHSNGKSLNNPKPEGIGQLVEQIKKIQGENAFWDKYVAKESKIYPVLVVGDSKILPDGLTFLMQKWYEERCFSEKVNTANLLQLIVMSISTLLLYSKEFEEKGFEHYFEEYYSSIKAAKERNSGDVLQNAVNATLSFSDYMQKAHVKNFVDIFNLYKGKLFPGHKK
jgi:large subunit ribosomal protein L17